MRSSVTWEPVHTRGLCHWPAVLRSVFDVGDRLACRELPNNSFLFPHGMVSIILVCPLQCHIHVCCLVCVMHMLKSGYWFLCIVCVLYILLLLIFLNVLHMNHQHQILIEEQQVNDINPLYELALMSRRYAFPNSVWFRTVHHTYINKGMSTLFRYLSFLFSTY